MPDDGAPQHKAEPARQASAAPVRRGFRAGLASRVLLLIAGFVMVAEVAVYVPSIASFRTTWLRDRVSSAFTAALVFEAAPGDVPEDLSRDVLLSVGARTIALKLADSRRLLAATDMPVEVAESFDVRDPPLPEAIMAAFRSLLAPPGRVLRIVGQAPMGGDYLEITLDEEPLRVAMYDYSLRILLLSLTISLFVAALAALAIHLLVLRPLRRLTSSIIDFGADPEDASRIIHPSDARHEIGEAEKALSIMQNALLRELNQKKHLAALGLAVAKINHDLRNMLASAQLLSDRLADAPDPLSRRLAPKLVSTLDRAIAFCQSTLVYGRAVERPPNLSPAPLRTIVVDAAETVAPPGVHAVEIIVEVPAGLQVRVDGEQMFRVMLNLLRNAVEALENAGPQPGRYAQVFVRARREAGHTQIEVVDTGPGVPEHARIHLFEAFQGAGRPGGTGLGLAIVADLVRAHGGTIHLDPAPDLGACFVIRLPDKDRG